MSGPDEPLREIAPGIFRAQLPMCTCQDLPDILVPVPSHVWVPHYRPVPAIRWTELPVPLAEDGPAVPLLVRNTGFELQMEREAFLALLPRLHAWSGMTAVQLTRPVPDTLSTLMKRDLLEAWPILRQNGWLQTFHLPHDHETAQLVSPDRAHLAAVLERAAAW